MILEGCDGFWTRPHNFHDCWGGFQIAEVDLVFADVDFMIAEVDLSIFNEFTDLDVFS